MKDSLQKALRKIKGVVDNKEVLLATLILLVGFGAFGLGRLSKIEEEKQPVIIQNAEETVNNQAVAASALNTANIDPSAVEGALVGSKNGSKYHFPWCSGAQRISEENKIWFSSKEEAEKSGYTPAANCKGL